MAERDGVGRLLCAIDTVELGAARGLARRLKDQVAGIKLGLEFCTANGPEGVQAVAAEGSPIFLDLKLYDIPNTVAGAVRAAGAMRPAMLTIHALGGSAMMRAAMGAAHRVAAASGGARPKVIAVTVLTSMDEEDLETLGLRGDVSEAVSRLAGLAQDSGVDGVVCSARELDRLRARCGPDFLLVVPGIRPAWSSADDQKRIVTPAEAIRRGADFLVVGRPITQASDPVAAAGRIADEMAGAPA
ncbi:MAG: orotidine-5'-phosphate decarboxylase [Alphaproteobacteria bacterium]